MKELGVKAYRFSVSWPRVLPDGVGAVNPKGIEFYDRLVDEILAAGIEPWCTLFHWDYPLALYHRGSWVNRESSDWFAEYAGVLAKRLGDRVTHWMPENEPQCFIGLGYQTGYHAPGDKLRLDEVLLAAHHVLMGHGKAIKVLRATAKARPTIGPALVGMTCMPEKETPADIEAARKHMFAITRPDFFNTTWWMDPMLLGQYPEDGLKVYGASVPRIQSGDMETICQPLDFLGLNIYHGTVVRAGGDGQPQEVPLPPGYPKVTQDFWPVLPSSLYWGPRYCYERYKRPVVITENGCQSADVISLDGKVHDPQRIDFLHRYLRELKRATADGVEVNGYFQWCFTDNFEWAMGDAMRAGLVYTDYPTQRRIAKDSARWYSQVIRSNGREL
jgi:beta-glucosidase